MGASHGLSHALHHDEHHGAARPSGARLCRSFRSSVVRRSGSDSERAGNQMTWVFDRVDAHVGIAWRHSFTFLPTPLCIHPHQP